MKRIYDIVEVDWFDAQSSMSNFDIEFIKKELVPLPSKSVGYLIHQTKKYVVLGFLLFGNEDIKHHQVIPKGMINKISVIKKKEVRND